MKKHTFIAVFLIVIASFSVFAGGNKESTRTEETMRIVSLAPNMTEIVYALGCQDYLIGRTEACDYPAECKDIPVAADMWMPSTESIVALEPTLVLVSSLTDPVCIESIRNAGINIQQVNYEDSLEGTYSLVLQVGKLLGKENEANRIVSEMSEKINRIKDKVSEVKDKKSCIYIIGWGDWGDYAATGDTFINDIIEASGCTNAASSAQFWSISKELLLNENPDVILLPDYASMNADVEGFTSTAPYNQLTGKIIRINGDKTERQGIRTPETVEEIAKAVYPELFK